MGLIANQVGRLILICSAMGFVLCSSLFPSSALHAQSLEPVQKIDDKNVSMVYVPPGEFEMGVTLEKAMELCRLLIPERFAATGCNSKIYQGEQFIASPQDVSVDAFYIDQYEVSLRSYLDCVNADVCSEESLGLQLIDAIQSGDKLPLDYPIERISYFNAAIYCAWREARLPTEAEWEYAARSPKDFIFPWGNEFDATRLNFGDDLYQATTSLHWNDGYPRSAPVNAFESGQSWVGAYNLAGNVAEWTSTSSINDYGLPDYYTRIVKGGSYLSYAHQTAGWSRMPLGQIGIPESIGFRCARTHF